MHPDVYHAYISAGEIASRIRREVRGCVREGESLLNIAEHIEERTRELGGTPAFPTTISVNEVASHFTPQDETLTLYRGDVVKIDLGVHIDGYIADTATTIEIGTSRHKKLIQAARDALAKTIPLIRDGITTGTIGATIHHTISSAGFNTLKELTGHNLARYTMHAGINIPSYQAAYSTTLYTDDVIAIEPFVTYGSGEIIKRKPTIYALRPGKHTANPLYKLVNKHFKTLPFTKRWLNTLDLTQLQSAVFIKGYPVLVTRDKQVVAQCEHTLIVEEEGATITTK